MMKRRWPKVALLLLVDLALGHGRRQELSHNIFRIHRHIDPTGVALITRRETLSPLCSGVRIVPEKWFAANCEVMTEALMISLLITMHGWPHGSCRPHRPRRP